MELVAFAVESAAPQPGDPIGLTLWFRAWRSMAEPLSVYVHLLPTDPPTEVPAFQEDHEHPAFWPLPHWTPSRLSSDFYALKVPPTVPPGVYRVKVGLYRRSPSGGRILGEGSRADGVVLPRIIRISPPDRRRPELEGDK